MLLGAYICPSTFLIMFTSMAQIQSAQSEIYRQNYIINGKKIVYITQLDSQAVNYNLDHFFHDSD